MIFLNVHQPIPGSGHCINTNDLSSRKENLQVPERPSYLFSNNAEADYAVCIKYEPISNNKSEFYASYNSLHSRKRYGKTNEYHEIPSNKFSCHCQADNTCSPTSDDLKNQGLLIKCGPIKCEVPEPYIQGNSRGSSLLYNAFNSNNGLSNTHFLDHSYCVYNYGKSDSSQKLELTSKRTREQKEPYECDVCGIKTYKLEYLEAHKRKHTRGKLHKCDVHSNNTIRSSELVKCNLWPSRLVLHKRKHTGVKPYKCELFSYSTCWSYALERHRRKHTGEKPYKCNMCSYSTAWSNALIVHKRFHTGKKPYKCDMCSYRTIALGNLIAHKRTHTGEKPYTCDVCNYSTAWSGDLDKHKRKHTGKKPYKCDMCSYSTARRSNLMMHYKRKHTREKSSLSNLASHKIKHTGKKMYLCEVCGFRSFLSSGLILHQRRHKIETSQM